MSRWRRVAIEHVPSCKLTIEKADSVGAMWSDLFGEVDYSWTLHHWSESTRMPTEQTLREVFAYALHCEKSRDWRQPEFDVWVFFHDAVGGFLVGDEAMRIELPKRIPGDVFDKWAAALDDLPTPEGFDKARRDFHVAQRKAK